MKINKIKRWRHLKIKSKRWRHLKMVSKNLHQPLEGLEYNTNPQIIKNLTKFQNLLKMIQVM